MPLSDALRFCHRASSLASSKAWRNCSNGPLRGRPRFEKIQCSESLRSSHVLDAATGEGIDQHVKRSTGTGKLFDFFFDCGVVGRCKPSCQLVHAAVNLITAFVGHSGADISLAKVAGQAAFSDGEAKSDDEILVLVDKDMRNNGRIARSTQTAETLIRSSNRAGCKGSLRPRSRPNRARMVATEDDLVNSPATGNAGHTL